MRIVDVGVSYEEKEMPFKDINNNDDELEDLFVLKGKKIIPIMATIPPLRDLDKMYVVYHLCYM